MSLDRLTAAVAIAALACACTQPDAEQPPAPVEPSAAPAAPATPTVGYACESGQTVSVQYVDAATARLTYQNQRYALRLVQSASGARYAGSNVEWWTATREGQESATLSRLGPNQDIGVAVLERCSRPSSGPLPTGPGQGGAAAPGGVTPVAAPCRGPQLKLTAEGGDAGVGNRVSTLAAQNLGAQACSLTGYPTVVLQDARGRALTTVRSEQTPGSYFRAGQAPTPVTLQPQGKALFDIAYSLVPNPAQGERVCPGAARIQVTAPGDTSPVALNHSFTPCGGRIQISPFRAVGATPQPAPTPAAAAPAARL
jgi:membrane-bound inhibitor of C-type lysozyme